MVQATLTMNLLDSKCRSKILWHILKISRRYLSSVISRNILYSYWLKDDINVIKKSNETNRILFVKLNYDKVDKMIGTLSTCNNHK